jgi:hypothetical protein
VDSPLKFTLVCALLFWSCWAVVVSGSRLISVYASQSDYSVVLSYQECAKPYNNRCDRHYILREGADGTETDLVPFAGQFPVDPLPVEMHIRKEKRSFIYEIDGTKDVWPSLAFYLVVLICGLGVIGIWFYLGGISYLRRSLERDD